jgi:anti-sigma factor ChrR (cupin superfamily)
MRTKCHKIEHRISGYIDGTLSERQTAAVASHLRSCQSCQREVADLKKTQHLLKNFYVEPDASDAYYAQFTAKLQQRIEQSAPTAPHQRFAAAATRLGWQLLTQIHRYTDHSRLSRFISIRQHVLPYYVLALAMTLLIAAPFFLTQVSLHNNGAHVHLPSAALQPAVTLAIQQDKTTVHPIGIRRNMNSERTTETPAVDSGSDVWKFTDEPMVDGYIFAKFRKDSSDVVPSVALGIDSELLAYAEFPAQGAIWARLTSRDVLTEGRYALLLLRGINTGQHALQQYERKRSESKGFSQISEKLLDVPLEMLSVAAVYDPIEL